MTSRLETPMMFSSQLKIIAAMPAFNEEATIAKVVLKLRRLVDHVIVCDDGSTDSTAEIAESLGAEVIRHERNLGYGAALSTLFERAKNEKPDIFITIDADGQHNPDDLPTLLEPLVRSEADIVIGSRSLKEGDGTPGYRRLGIKLINSATNIFSGQAIRDTQSGFRAYNRRALDKIAPSEAGMGASVELLLKAKENRLLVAEVPVYMSYKDSASRNPLFHGLDVLLALVKHMSLRHPLLFYGMPGLVLFGLGLGFGLWAIDVYAATKALATGITLLSVASLMLGVILMTTSVILWVMVTVMNGRRQ